MDEQLDVLKANGLFCCHATWPLSQSNQRRKELNIDSRTIPNLLHITFLYT